MNYKKIIFVGAYTEGMAASNFVLSFAKGYANLGMEVTLIINTPDKNFTFSFDEINVTIIREEGIWILSKLLTYKRILKEINKVYTDDSIIQSYGNSLWNLFSFKRRRVFYTIGERPFANPNYSLVTKLYEVFGLLSIRKATGLLVQTKNLKSYYQNVGIKNVNVFNILIDPKRFQGIEKSTSDKNITYCGIVSQYKDGLMYLLESFKNIQKLHPEYKLRVVGKFYSYSEEQKLRSFVNDNQMQDNVLFTGLLPADYIPNLLINSDILVLARPDNRQSKYGFPSKLGEYLMSGNPVLVTKVGEIPDFLEDEITCKYAEPDDVNSFTKGLEWIINNSEASKKIGLNGKKFAFEHFSIDSQCKKCLGFMTSHVI